MRSGAPESQPSLRAVWRENQWEEDVEQTGEHPSISSAPSHSSAVLFQGSRTAWESTSSGQRHQCPGKGGCRAGWLGLLLWGNSPPLLASPTLHAQSLTRQKFPEGPATEDSPWGCFTCCCFATPPTLGHVYGHQCLSPCSVRSGCSAKSC